MTLRDRFIKDLSEIESILEIYGKDKAIQQIRIIRRRYQGEQLPERFKIFAPPTSLP